jgi:hypothetical protein
LGQILNQFWNSESVTYIFVYDGGLLMHCKIFTNTGETSVEWLGLPLRRCVSETQDDGYPEIFA